MARDKYSRDYRLIEEFNERGRVRTDYEYIGDPYYFSVDAAAVEEEKKKALRLILFTGAAFVASLIPYSEVMHRLFIALPFAFTALPVFMMADLVLAMQKYPLPMEHRHADKLNNRYPALALAILYLSGIALAGEAVFVIRNGILVPGDAVIIFGTAVIFACGFGLFRKRKTFRAEAR